MPWFTLLTIASQANIDSMLNTAYSKQCCSHRCTSPCFDCHIAQTSSWLAAHIWTR